MRGDERIDYASIYQDNDDISKIVVVIGAAIYLKTSLFNNRYTLVLHSNSFISRKNLLIFWF